MLFQAGVLYLVCMYRLCGKRTVSGRDPHLFSCSAGIPRLFSGCGGPESCIDALLFRYDGLQDPAHLDGVPAARKENLRVRVLCRLRASGLFYRICEGLFTAAETMPRHSVPQA